MDSSKQRMKPNPWCHWVLLLGIMNFISSVEQSTSNSTSHWTQIITIVITKVCSTTTQKQQKQWILQNALYPQKRRNKFQTAWRSQHTQQWQINPQWWFVFWNILSWTYRSSEYISQAEQPGNSDNSAVLELPAYTIPPELWPVTHFRNRSKPTGSQISH